MSFLTKVPAKAAKPKKKRDVDPCKRSVPSTVLDRWIGKSQVEEEARTKNRLYASSVCCDQYFDPSKELFRFWSIPEFEKSDYFSEVRMDQGNVKHAALQNHLHSTGLLHPLCTNEDGEFEEPRAMFEEFAVSGKIDLIVPSAADLKKLDKSKDSYEVKTYEVCDIKETMLAYYKGISLNLRQSYRGQVSLYIKWFHETHGGPEKTGSFWYHTRDNSKKHKMFHYEKEPHLIDLAIKRGKEHINHIANRTFPNKELTSSWISEQIDMWKERDSKLPEEKRRNWPEYANVNY